MFDKKMSSADLWKVADIAPNTLTRMKRDHEVTVQVLERICDVLDAVFGDIIEFNRLNHVKSTNRTKHCDWRSLSCSRNNG